MTKRKNSRYRKRDSAIDPYKNLVSDIITNAIKEVSGQIDFVEILFTDGTSIEFVSTEGEITFSTKERVNGKLLEFMPGNINNNLH